MTLLQHPVSVLDVFTAYDRSIQDSESPQKAQAIMAQLQTALLRYTLPGWGFPMPQGQRLKAAEVQAGLEYLKQVALDQLLDAPTVQEQMFELLQVPGNSRRNYRLALNKMMDWCRQQPWYPLAQEPPRPRISRRHTPKRSVVKERLTSRKKMEDYGLGAIPSDVIPAQLQQELEAFHRFLVTPEQHHGAKGAVGKSTAKQYMQHLLMVLGWLYRIQQVPLVDLSLTKVVEFVPLCSQQVEAVVTAAAAEQTIQLVKAYLNWLQSQQPEMPLPLFQQTGRGSQSPHTASKVWLTILAVAKFLYHGETNYPKVGQYQDIPVIERIRKEQKAAIAAIREHSLLSDQSKKQLDRTGFLELVESLRSECAPRFWQNTQSKNQGKTLGPMRSLAGIAQSYQRFLLATFLAHLLPLRQRVYRQLNVVFEPVTEHQDPVFPSESGAYLYQQGSNWWIKVFPDLYKQSKDNSQSCLEQIPNLQYADGRCFYQYLAEWLLSYSYEDKDKTLRLKGLRSIFNPQHGYVFTMKSGLPYTHPTSFAALLRIPAYRLMGKVLTPDSVRLMLLDDVEDMTCLGR